jgi:pimeloyl-ACP methyl ester carboxylesterase
MWWLQPLPADQVALQTLEGGSGVVVEQNRSAVILAPSGEAKAGLVLYPGARVDPRAYAALGSRLAERGYRVVIVKCPYDLALLCRGDGSGYVDDEMPWMIGGHSLGGPVSVRDARDDASYDGVLLWAAYPLDDLSDRTTLTVASISGTRDAFTTPEDVSSTADLLPASTAFTAIDGAIHSFFGDYGIQPGDGDPTTTREQAQNRIVAATDRALRRMIAATGP